MTKGDTMLDPTQPFTDEDFAFIRGRGTLYGEGNVWKTESEAADAIADGWTLVANMLHAKGVSEADARKAARVFTDAAWAEWRRSRG